MARYTDTVRDQYGAPISGVLVTVNASDSGLAAVLTSDGGQPLLQPLITDGSGGYYFNASDTLYDVSFRYGGRLILKNEGVVVGDASTLPAGSVFNALGTSTTTAPSQAAVQGGLDSKANASDLAPVAATAADAQTKASLAIFAPIYTTPTVVIGSTDQSPSLEGSAPTVTFTRSNDLAFLQVSATARDKTAPSGGFGDGDALRITALPFTANGIQPQILQLEPDTGLPEDAYAALVGDTIGFYRPGRVPVTFDMLADNYFLRVGGIVAVLPETAS